MKHPWYNLPMRVAIIGGGFTGLAAAYELTKHGHRVTVFEKEKILGGLAHGFKEPSWKWHLESTYHHFFTNDHAIINLIKELGLEKKLIIKRPITANLLPHLAGRRGVSSRVMALAEKTIWEESDLDLDGARATTHRPQQDVLTNGGRIVQFDSPMHLLTFPGLSLVDKVRTAFLLAFLKLNPFWKPLEGITAEQLLISVGGKRSYEVLWEPLLMGKFGDLASTVGASWFWARIKKRTPSLGYIEGGFQTLINALSNAITRYGGIIYTNTSINSIKNELRIMNHESWKSKYHYSPFTIHNSPFDRVLLTVPTPIAKKIAPFIPASYFTIPSTIPHLHAQTLILETKEPILKNTYWLNITDTSYPFLAAVAHTNFMDKTHYGNHHLTYFGNYLPEGHPYLSMTKEQLLKVFLPFIKRLNPTYHLSPASLREAGRALVACHLFIGPFAQPVHQLHYSQKAPALLTPIPGIYLANMDSIYPWDRGTNYAVELGIRAANRIMNSES